MKKFLSALFYPVEFLGAMGIFAFLLVEDSKLSMWSRVCGALIALALFPFSLAVIVYATLVEKVTNARR